MVRKKASDQEQLDREIKKTAELIDAAISKERIPEPTPAVTVHAPGSGPEVVQTAEPERAGKTAGIAPEPEKARPLRLKKIASRTAAGLAGALSALLLVTMYLAGKGIYVEPLRPFWSPVPSEDVKWVLAILVLLGSAFVVMWGGKAE